jgi:hypothetical protein
LVYLALTRIVAGSPGFTLAVYGNYFPPGSVVRWNGSDRVTTRPSSGVTDSETPRDPRSANSPFYDRLDAAILKSDLAVPGIAEVTVFAPGPDGGTSGPLGFTIEATNPIPTITQLEPAGASAGDPQTTLIVYGGTFVFESVVRWNGADRATTFRYASGSSLPDRLEAVIPASDLAAPGVASVTVFNPGPGGGLSNAVSFPIGDNGPRPVITGLSPERVVVGGPAFVLTVHGANFTPGTEVEMDRGSWPYQPIETVVNSSTIVAEISAAVRDAAGTFDVYVTAPPTGRKSNTVKFVVESNGIPPVLSSLSPSTAFAGRDEFTLSVEGARFAFDATVLWNGSKRATTFWSNASLSATILAADVATAGTAAVSVLNPDGRISNVLTFQVTASGPEPKITSMEPAIAKAGGSGFKLVLYGSNFIADSVLLWNGSARPTQVGADFQLTASIGSEDIAVPGSASVTVRNPYMGGAVESRSFTFRIAGNEPVLEIELNKASFVPGDTVTASVFRLRNPRETPAAAEVKVWLTADGYQFTVLNLGSDGSAVLPAGYSQDVGPFGLMLVSPNTQNGEYELSSRVLDPVTGELLSEDLNLFFVTGAKSTRGPGLVEANVWDYPAIDVALNRTSFSSGDSVTVTQLRLKTLAAFAPEVKVWLGAPNSKPTTVSSIGADGSFKLPESFEVDLAPIDLFAVSSSTAPGKYEFGGRTVDPVTGKQRSQSIQSFTVK